MKFSLKNALLVGTVLIASASVVHGSCPEIKSSDIPHLELDKVDKKKGKLARVGNFTWRLMVTRDFDTRRWTKPSQYEVIEGSGSTNNMCTYMILGTGHGDDHMPILGEFKLTKYDPKAKKK